MRSANGSKHLGTVYADNIAFNLGALLSEQQLKSVLPSANMDEDFRPSRPLLPNETKSFYLPLVGGFLDTADLYWRNIQGDFFLDFFPSSSSKSLPVLLPKKFLKKKCFFVLPKTTAYAVSPVLKGGVCSITCNLAQVLSILHSDKAIFSPTGPPRISDDPVWRGVVGVISDDLYTVIHLTWTTL